MANERRIVALIDMDCFFAQVEQRERPELWGMPVVVVQHSGGGTAGGILAVSYEARERGVKRLMFVDEVKKLCPEVAICHVPQGEHIDKADIAKYREASAEVFEVLNSWDPLLVVEKASIDEAFLELGPLVQRTLNTCTREELIKENVADLFPTTHLADGNDVNEERMEDWHYNREEKLHTWFESYCVAVEDHLKLAIGAAIMEKIRATIQERTQFHCSAGIANNKMLAKLVCSRHKPRQQTVISEDWVPTIFHNTSIQNVRGFGGKLGRSIIEGLKITVTLLLVEKTVQTMGELAMFDVKELTEKFPDAGHWLFEVAKGRDDEPVRPRDKPKSIAVSRNFPGERAIKTVAVMKEWVEGLSKELCKRLLADQSANQRTAQSLVFLVSHSRHEHFTRTHRLTTYDSTLMAKMLWTTAVSMNKATQPDLWSIFLLDQWLFVDRVEGRSRSIVEWVQKMTKEAKEHNRPSYSHVAEEDDEEDVLRDDSDDGEKEEDREEADVTLDEGRETSWEQTPPDLLPSTSKDDSVVIIDVKLKQTKKPPTSKCLVPAQMEDDLEEIDPEVLKEMPAEIRRELAHQYHLKQARASNASKEAEKKGRKRTTTTVQPHQAKKPASVADFFKKH